MFWKIEGSPATVSRCPRFPTMFRQLDALFDFFLTYPMLELSGPTGAWKTEESSEDARADPFQKRRNSLFFRILCPKSTGLRSISYDATKTGRSKERFHLLFQRTMGSKLIIIQVSSIGIKIFVFNWFGDVHLGAKTDVISQVTDHQSSV